MSAWLSSYDQSDTKLFLSFFTGECAIFSYLEKVKQFTHAFPYLARIISEMLAYYSTEFLPSHLAEFMMSLLKLIDDFDQKAEQ